jgi:hypothetical protein
MELPGARGSESRAEITRRIRSSERCDTSSGPFCELPFRTRRVRGRFTAPLRPRTRATRPCRHVRSRCTETTEPRGVCGRARTVAWRASCAPRNDYRSASSLAGHPVWIIGVRDETGNIVPRASVGATSVVGDRARVRRFRRIRNLRISGRPAQTAAALAEACGQAASHPRIGGTGVPSPGLSEQACLATSAGSISAHAARQPNTAASRAEKLVLGSAPLASHSSETGRRRHRPLSTPTAASAGQTSSPRFRHSSTRSSRNTTESISSRAR